MSLLDSATSSYAETVTNTVPFHRAALFFVSALLFLANRSKGSEGLLQFLWSLPASELTSLSSNFLIASTVGDFLSAAGIVAISAISTKAAARAIFALALRSTSLISKINLITINSDGLTISNRKKAIELAKSSIEPITKRLRSINRLTEFLIGCGLQITAFSALNFSLELFIGGILTLLSVVFLAYGVKLFISDYFGVAMYVAKLEGKPHPAPGDIK